jgi:hypothetical protein
LKFDMVTPGRWFAARCMVAALALMPFVGAGCTSRPNVAGKWEGLLNASVMVGATAKAEDATFHVALNIRGENDHLRASYESREDRSGPVPVDIVEFRNGSLYVKFRKQGGTYEARLNPESTELYGDFKQGGYVIPLVLRRTPRS